MLNENCSVFQSVQKSTAHQQCASRGLASFSISLALYICIDIITTYSANTTPVSSIRHIYSIHILIIMHTCNLHSTERIGLCSYYKALNKTYSYWFLVVFTSKTKHHTFTPNIKASRCSTENAIKQFCNYTGRVKIIGGFCKTIFSQILNRNT